MSRLETLMTEERRLHILRLLDESNNTTAPDAVLNMVLREMGMGVSHDRLATDLEWLREQGLVLRNSIGGIAQATATMHGVDVARGQARVPGVARPKPGA